VGLISCEVSEELQGQRQQQAVVAVRLRDVLKVEVVAEVEPFHPRLDALVAAAAR
jgi:hypothetical protein